MTTRHPDDVLDGNPEWDATNTRPLDTPSAQLRAARAVLGLTQAAMADLLGVPVATLRNWEQGRTAPDDAGRTLIPPARREPAGGLSVAFRVRFA